MDGEIPSVPGLPPEFAAVVQLGRDAVNGMRGMLQLHERQVIALERIAQVLEDTQVGGQLPRDS